MEWLACGDESMRQRPDRSGLYVVAALVVDSGVAGDMRAAMEGLARRRLPFHWREADSRRRLQAAQLISEFGAVHCVVVGRGLDNRRQERHRRKCLQRLLWELERLGVARLILDARRPEQDLRDRAAVSAWRAQHIVGPGLRIDHVRARDEPLVWAADTLAGVTASARGDGDQRYLKLLEPTLAEVTIALD